ncbi:MAG: ABC transporter ATP-binding protein [Oscillospiraceae bacterium]|nr:ABC transporter ATP-binding protein [Oscillospiraceae bacterium]
MRKLLVHLREYKKETVLGPLFKLLEASFELFVPLVVAAIVDIGIANGDKPYIAWMCLLLVGLGVIGLVCAITAQYFAAKASVGFASKLRRALFAHIQNLSFSEMDTIGTSTLITRMTSDLNQVQSGLNLFLRLFLRSPFVVFGAMVMAFTVDVKAALVFVVTIPLLSVVVFGIMLWSIPMYQKVQAALDKVLGTTRENLTGVRVIRAFGQEEQEKERFSGYNAALTKLQTFVGRVSALMNPVTYIIINLAIVAVIWVGGHQVDTGVLTQGEVVALVNYMSQILVELVKLANLIISVTKAVACARRVSGIMDIQSSMEDKGSVQTCGSEDAIVFDHVSLTYKNAGAESLSDISFTVKKGETVGIIGGTGSGKSSLVSMIPRFYDATEGRVLVNGADVREQPLQALREKVAVVMQKAVLFKGSVEENLRWGKRDATEEEMYRALEIAQARDFVDAKPRKLKEHIEQGGKNLSGGQRQRLTIARALISEPEILILDDSASALDFATDARLRAAIRENSEDMTVLIVSQRASTVLHADKIIVMDDGEMAGIGTHDQLIESCPVYQEIYYSQFPKEVKA